MTELGFYIGTFHNDNGRYTDEIRVTGKPEVFEVDDLGYGSKEVFRLNDKFHYQIEDFINLRFLDKSVVTETDNTLIRNHWYWVQYQKCDWEVIQAASDLSRTKFRRIGIEGTFTCNRIQELVIGPRIDFTDLKGKTYYPYEGYRPDIISIDDKGLDETIRRE